MHPATRRAQVTVGVLGRVIRSLVIPVLHEQLGNLPPEPEDVDSMLEGLTPPSVSVEMRSNLEHSLTLLDDVVEALEHAARITRAELVREFEPPKEGV